MGEPDSPKEPHGDKFQPTAKVTTDGRMGRRDSDDGSLKSPDAERQGPRPPLSPNQAVRVQAHPDPRPAPVAAPPVEEPYDIPRAEPEAPVWPPINEDTLTGSLFMKLRSAAGLSLKEAADCLHMNYAELLDFEDGDEMVVLTEEEIDRCERFFTAVGVLK